MPDLAPFFRNIRKTRIAMGVLAAICLPFGVLLLFLNDSTLSEAANLAARFGLGGFFLALGGYFSYLGLRSPTKDKGIRALLERQGDIVWVYPVRHLSHGNHVATRYTLHMVDGKTAQVGVQPGDEAWAERFFQSHCPTALFGFHRDWEQKYRSDPRLLSPENR